MTNFEQVVENDAGSSLIEQLGRALHELEACKDSSEDKVQWMEIEEHFRNLETVLKKKSEELEAREKEYDDKEAETRALLAERELAVVTKELELLDRIQELKDAAVSVIAEARANHQPSSLECIDGGDNINRKVSSSLAEINYPGEYSQKMGENADGVAADVKPRPELKQFCEQMDAKGLLSFAMENQKNLYAIRDELSVALEIATEPARLVLDSLEGFYPPVETTQQMDKKDAALQGMRKSCVIFMEAMAALLARIDPGADHLLNPEIKQQAKAFADEWKPKLASAGTDATNGDPLEAEAFLQLLSTFRITSEFDEEELCKLVLVIAQRRQAPELCHSLGLTHKIPDVVESLLNDGKQIDAVRFIHAFQLTEVFPPVPLLKTYLKDLRRNSQNTQRKGGNSGGGAGVQVDGNALELAALKVVIRCVEEYKLEADYPLDPLQKRLAQLEKSKSDKKRAGDFGKHYQSKKPKPNRGYRGLRGAATGPAGGWRAPPPWTAFPGMLPERYPHTVPNPYEYQIPSQSAYGQQANDQKMYYNPQDDRVPAAASYSAAPPNYGSYMGAGTRSSHQPYMQ
ncbi:FRIGIDA-LIKE PROTEIN 3-RELATED [Salix purpurea]|uniref:FRIGIDA-like protein n=1 Tax=Salix purpurea TaxID=77065 RepID=A0A9Q0V291_SALPP|nr:FRIGIDA-LIKE PROTEIN 3-RELATED [Salix purpurea]